MALRFLARVVAWTLLAVIFTLSIVPPADRPVVAPHVLEHTAIFAAAGIAFGVAYLGHERWLYIGAVACCAGIELAQRMVPGRHARLEDFIMDVASACIGLLAASVLARATAAILTREQALRGRADRTPP